jgi:hypothetical protein
MVRRYAGLERRKHENFPFWADLENTATAIADVEIAISVEGNAVAIPMPSVNICMLPEGRWNTRCRQTGWKRTNRPSC